MNKKIMIVIFAVMLLAGCVNMQMEQELHRDGTSDLVMEVSLDLPPMMQDQEGDQFEEIESDLREEFGEEYGEKVKATEIENGFRIEFYGIDMTSEESLGEFMDETPGTEGELHTFEEDSSLFTKRYRYEIPFESEEEIMNPEASFGGPEETHNVQESINEDMPEQPSDITPESDLPEAPTMDGMDDFIDEEMLAQMFDIKYTLTVFADIDDTNGEIIDDRTVEFDLIQMEEDGYVEFSENRIAGWFSGWFS